MPGVPLIGKTYVAIVVFPRPPAPPPPVPPVETPVVPPVSRAPPPPPPYAIAFKVPDETPAPPLPLVAVALPANPTASEPAPPPPFRPGTQFVGCAVDPAPPAFKTVETVPALVIVVAANEPPPAPPLGLDTGMDGFLSPPLPPCATKVSKVELAPSLPFRLETPGEDAVVAMTGDAPPDPTVISLVASAVTAIWRSITT